MGTTPGSAGDSSIQDNKSMTGDSQLAKAQNESSTELGKQVQDMQKELALKGTDKGVTTGSTAEAVRLTDADTQKKAEQAPFIRAALVPDEHVTTLHRQSQEAVASGNHEQMKAAVLNNDKVIASITQALKHAQKAGFQVDIG